MSRLFGSILQNGFVVRDIEAAMRHWIEVLEVGPWFYFEHIPFIDFRYKGEPSPVDVSLALANSGNFQVELIQQRNDAPSLYRDFIAAGHEGLQHVGYGTHQFDADVARYVEAGFEIGHSGSVGGRGAFVYLLTEGHPGTVVELFDMSSGREEVFAAIAEAARTWDGSEPIRTSLPTAPPPSPPPRRGEGTKTSPVKGFAPSPLVERVGVRGKAEARHDTRIEGEHTWHWLGQPTTRP